MAHAMTAIPAGATRRVALGPGAPVRVAPTVRTLRRRRLMVLLAAVTTAVLLVLAASRAAATFRDVPASVPERRPVPALDAAATSGSAAATARHAASGYVVQPGDTLWSIARRFQPDGDVRPLVDQLVDLNGGPDLAVGQWLPIP
jgi:nucleoid-associated protein YgaU